MCRALVMLFCLALLVANRGFAEEANLPGAPRPAPVRALTSESSGDTSEKSPDKTIDHLLKAADHLDAAGLAEQAAKLRNDARRRALREDVLGRKESELECLQEEVDRLRALTGHVSTILVRIVAVEVDRQMLGLKAGEFDKMVGRAQRDSSRITANTGNRTGYNPATAEQSGITEINPARLPLFREFLEKGAIRVLAEPNLTTIPGRVAEFMDGGLMPVRVHSASGKVEVEHVWFGTRFEVRAMLLPAQRMRLNTVFELRRKEISEVVGDGGSEQTGFVGERLSSSTEILVGQTLTLGRVIKPRGIELVVFVTPELVDSPIVPRALHGVPEAGTEDELSEAIEPAVFEPVDWDLFGPPVPILRRAWGN